MSLNFDKNCKKILQTTDPPLDGKKQAKKEGIAENSFDKCSRERL